MDKQVKKIRLEALIPFDEVIHAKKNLALAEAGSKRNEEIERFKPLARAHGKRIKELDADISRLSEEVLKGAAMGMVDAEEHWDWDNFTKRTVRCDTGETVIGPEPMSAEERREPPLVDVGEPEPGTEPKVVKLKRKPKADPAMAPH
jgi:hypothetical protein